MFSSYYYFSILQQNMLSVNRNLLYICTYLYTHICIHTPKHKCICIYIHIFISISICVYIYIYNTLFIINLNYKLYACKLNLDNKLLFLYSSNATYAPNGEYILVSTLDSTHRLFSSAQGGSLPGAKGIEYLKSFKSHVNARYSIFSSMKSSIIDGHTKAYFASGSEDNQVIPYLYILYLCMYIYMYIYMYIHTSVFIYPCLHACRYIYRYMTFEHNTLKISEHHAKMHINTFTYTNRYVFNHMNAYILLFRI
jgi:hypothetical protein